MSRLPVLNMSRRFALLLAGMIFMTAVSAGLFYSRQEGMDMEIRLREKTTFINNFYSLLIADALIRKDDVTLLKVVNTLEQDPEVTSVVVVDQKNEVRYDADPRKMSETLDDPMVQNVLRSGDSVLAPFQNAGGKALVLVSPLKLPGLALPIGAVRIDLTYRRIQEQLAVSRQRFWFITLGSVVSCLGFVLLFVTRWVIKPLQGLQSSLAAFNTAAPESNLPEPTDEFGPVYRALNDLFLRFKSEMQQQGSQLQARGEQEKAWVRQLASSFAPGARVIVADKDNRVVSDSGNGGPASTEHPHLMDLIKDSDFANLLSSAFQKEGELARGPVAFEEKPYLATILSVPAQQSVVVKTLIALQPN